MGNCPERGEAAHEGENIILTAGERDATAALTALQLRHPDGRTRRSDRHPPYRQIYFSVSGEKDSCKEEKDAL